MKYTETINPVTPEPKRIIPDAESPNAHSPEQMHVILTTHIQHAEAGEEKLIPNEEVFEQIRLRYGF